MLRTLALWKEPWFDEMCSLEFAGGNLKHLMGLDHPPLYFFLNGLFRVGHDPVRGRLVALLWSVLFLLLVLFVCSRRYARGTVPALALASTMPFLVRYGIEIRDYGLLVLLTGLAVSLINLYLEGKRDPWVVRALLLTLALCSFTHGVGLMVGPAILCMCLPERKKAPLQPEFLAGLVFVPLLATLVWVAGWDVVHKTKSSEWIGRPSPHSLLVDLVRLAVGYTDQAA